MSNHHWESKRKKIFGIVSLAVLGSGFLIVPLCMAWCSCRNWNKQQEMARRKRQEENQLRLILANASPPSFESLGAGFRVEIIEPPPAYSTLSTIWIDETNQKNYEKYLETLPPPPYTPSSNS